MSSVDVRGMDSGDVVVDVQTTDIDSHQDGTQDFRFPTLSLVTIPSSD